MYIEYSIINNQIKILSKSDNIINSSNIVAKVDSFDKFNDFKNRYNSNKVETQVFNLPNDIWENISKIESDQIYNWYLIEDWRNIYKKHNKEKYSDLHYCCSRHREVVRKNLKLLDYGV